MDLPLADIRVIDLTIARAGPTCVRQLADWGADVIRVEPPGDRPATRQRGTPLQAVGMPAISSICTAISGPCPST